MDVARQLFAKMGVENTTMNDIALASKKGRRTLYTYFKSKEDIYMAVVESELDILSDIMKRDVLREGVEKGVFQVDDIDMTAELVHYSVKGIEVPYIRGHIGAKLTDETRGQYVENIVFGALRRKE